jgi:hypothetical protein
VTPSAVLLDYERRFEPSKNANFLVKLAHEG